jgi:hypothetical protein
VGDELATSVGGRRQERARASYRSSVAA